MNDNTTIAGHVHSGFQPDSSMPQDAEAILAQNRESWNAIADDWFGTTALPEYGCLIPTEDELGLFGDVSGKKLLEIGCGSGHSLLYHAKHAAELWGLDLSDRQLENAGRLLAENGFAPRLFQSPMERDPGLPKDYFDFVYSIYAVGWSTDLPATFRLAASYLKPGGTFIFSWDHPMMHCVGPENNRYVLDGGFYDKVPICFEKGGAPMTLTNRRFADYVDALAAAELVLEKIVEETSATVMDAPPSEFSSKYYAASKARLMPLSFIMKARKPGNTL
uniref:Putative methyltransferase n=1 Tax=termite gut metagenome TaxID=433724 RepID=S0DG41_9ZZZZ